MQPQESGFYYLQSRYYDPSIGRFINADAAEYAISVLDDLDRTNLFTYCGNNPVNRVDQVGQDWKTAFTVGFAVALIGLTVLATISTGGGALLLAATGLSVASAMAAANTVVASGMAVMAGSLVMATSTGGGSTPSGPNRNNQNNYQKARNNSTANKWAQKVGEKNAEALKEWYVGKNNISKFNMLRDKTTGQIILESIKTGLKIYTDYYLK